MQTFSTMDAMKLKETFLKSHLTGETDVIAILPSGDWFRVADGEPIPENCMITLHPKNWEKTVREE